MCCSSQIYAIRQAIAKAIVAFTAKYEDASTALELKKALATYDRSLLVADPRRCEPKKFGPLFLAFSSVLPCLPVVDMSLLRRRSWRPSEVPKVCTVGIYVSKGSKRSHSSRARTGHTVDWQPAFSLHRTRFFLHILATHDVRRAQRRPVGRGCGSCDAGGCARCPAAVPGSRRCAIYWRLDKNGASRLES